MLVGRLTFVAFSFALKNSQKSKKEEGMMFLMRSSENNNAKQNAVLMGYQMWGANQCKWGRWSLRSPTGEPNVDKINDVGLCAGWKLRQRFSNCILRRPSIYYRASVCKRRMKGYACRLRCSWERQTCLCPAQPIFQLRNFISLPASLECCSKGLPLVSGATLNLE